MRTLLTGLIGAAVLAASSTPQSPRNEPYRPQVHFSQEQFWMNDPNGLVYFEGEYHLFFQYNPTAMVPGHIGWGHAVSRDLLHWQQLPEALPEHDGEMEFTGSVVIDKTNSSGLCQGGRACMVAVYTGHKDGPPRIEAQNIAVSQDRGRTWTRYEGNPVLDLHQPEFRDPGVSWNEVTKSWVMAVARPNEHQVSLYSSADLKHWEHLSDFGPAGGATGGQWECPNLLKVPSADGRSSVWAMKVGINPGGLQGGSGEQYFLGSFDGRDFTPSSEAGSHGWTDYGKDSYCAISYNNLPAGSQPVLLGWMNNWQYADKVPTSPWRGQMTMPRRLAWSRDASGSMLIERPVVEPLRQGPPVVFQSKLDAKGNDLLTGSPVEIAATFSPADAGSFGLRLYSDEAHWTEVGYSTSPGALYVDRTHSGQIVGPNFSSRTETATVPGRGYDLHILVDRDSVEVFAQGGSIAMTNLIFPPSNAVRIVPFRNGGNGAGSVQGRVWKLKPVWNAKVSQ